MSLFPHKKIRWRARCPTIFPLTRNNSPVWNYLLLYASPSPRASKPQKLVYSRVHHFSFPICVDRSTNGTRIRPWPYSANDIFQTLLGLRSRLRESAPHRSRDATGVYGIARIVRNGKRCGAVNEFLLLLLLLPGEKKKKVEGFWETNLHRIN